MTSATREIPTEPKRWTRWIGPPYLVVLGCVLITIRGWSFLALPMEGLWLLAEKATVVGLVGAILVLRGPGPRVDERSAFLYFVLSLLLFSFTTFIPLAIHNDQSPVSSLNAAFPILLWLLYFHLRRHRIDRDDLVRLCVVVGSVWAVLNIVQQFTYPAGLFFFYTRYNPTLPEPVEYRAGVYRFMIDGTYYGQLALFWSTTRYFQTRRTRFLALAMLLLAGTYYAGTRQVLLFSLAGCGVVAGWHILRKGRRLELSFVLLLLAIGTALLAFSEALFGKLVEMTKEESNEDNIRVASFQFFMFEYWPHRMNFLLGNGMPRYLSEEGMRLRLLMSKGFYQTDVGIAGTLSVFGIFYAVVSTLFLVYGCVRRIGFEHAHLKATFVFLLLGLPISALFLTTSAYPFYCILMYLVDDAIREDASRRRSDEPVRIHWNVPR